MTRGILLYTERPELLPREKATHEWFFREKPWEKLDLELAYDNAPGGWIHYDLAFRGKWSEANVRGLPLIVAESDVLFTLEAFRAMLECPQPVCTVPYWVHDYDTGERKGIGAWVELRMRGGWLSRWAIEGEDEWGAGSDLGLVKFGVSALRRLNLAEVALPARPNDQLHQKVFERLKYRHPDPQAAREGKIVHLHWPALTTNHTRWDEGDRQLNEPTAAGAVVP